MTICIKLLQQLIFRDHPLSEEEDDVVMEESEEESDSVLLAAASQATYRSLNIAINAISYTISPKEHKQIEKDLKKVHQDNSSLNLVRGVSK